MSLTKNGRNFRSDSGKSFPDDTAHPGFAPAVAAALKSEFGGSTSAVKSVGRLTGANERTVRNWFEGRNGPGGDYLIALIRHSDTVLRTVLILSDRRDFALGGDVLSLRAQLQALMEALDEIHPG